MAELKTVPIGAIKPYENNPRKNDEAVAAVAESIRQCGYIAPIVVDDEMTVLAGHTRLKALQSLGKAEAEVLIRAGLTDEQKRKYRILDNKTAELADWAFDLLEQELAGLDFDGFDFDFGIEPADKEDAFDDDYIEEVPVNPKSKPGQLYLLGHHRLLCGDATSEEDVRRVNGGVLADLLLTDPPYNVDYTGKTKDALKIENDVQETGAFEDFLVDAFTAARENMKPGAAFYIWHADSNGHQFRNACEAVGLQTRECLIWAKNVMVLGRQDYQWQHEPCLYGWKDGAAHYFIDDRTQTTLFEDTRPDIAKMKKEEMRELLEQLFADKVSTKILHEKKPAASTLHPTMKPVPLMGRLIKNSTRPGETVLDPFGGSGSTLIACEQLGRVCHTMELDPKYCDVIIDRWEQFTGQKAVLAE